MSPIDAASRHTAPLIALANTGGVHAVRVIWSEGLDRVIATPFHGAVDDNGQATTGGAIIDLRAYDEKQLEGEDHVEAAGAGLALQRHGLGDGCPDGDDR